MQQNVERFHSKKVLCLCICVNDKKISLITQSIGIWQLTLTQPLVYTAEICFKEIVEEKIASKVYTNNIKFEYVSSGY
jgi:hypothetical protein